MAYTGTTIKLGSYYRFVVSGWDYGIFLQVLNVLIVVAYADGEPADAHLIDPDLCRKYWLKWLQRLQKYQTQFAEDLSDIIS